MKTQVLTNLLAATGAMLLLGACAAVQPPPPPPGARSLDQPPGAGNRYLQGTENLPPAGAPPAPAPVMPTDPNAPYTPPPPPGDPAAVQPPTTTDAPPPVTPAPAPTDPAAPAPTAPTPPPASGADALPFGIKVPDKPGMVLSPYDKTAGIVDVQGIAPGKKVKCPYTGKIFRVP